MVNNPPTAPAQPGLPDPTFTVTFVKLVDTMYSRIVSRFPKQGKYIPFALFRYYCFQLFWLRVLSLQRIEGQVLTTDQKDFLNTFSFRPEFLVPRPIADYLTEVPLCLRPDDLDVKMTGLASWPNPITEGWVDCGDGAARVTTPHKRWAYTSLPVPAVFCTAICNEIRHNEGGQRLLGLEHLASSDFPEAWEDGRTSNIIGWLTAASQRLYNHPSHRPTYYNLGWRSDLIPVDVMTSYLFSASTMRAMSDKLDAFSDLEAVGSNKLADWTAALNGKCAARRTECPSTELPTITN